ncbi:MAG: hypothetical protein JWO28_127, partial [Hyphomicrobiales bacterium]|nr:hypothetical protein [Hyphomicrobiales bacterium]
VLLRKLAGNRPLKQHGDVAHGPVVDAPAVHLPAPAASAPVREMDHA